VWLERLGWLWRRLGTGWRQVLRNLVRNGRRSLIGAFAAGMGAALLVTGLLARRAVLEVVDFQYRRITRSDVDLTFRQEHGYDALREARGLPGVLYAEPVLSVGCTFRNGPHSKRGGITGLAAGARLTVPSDQDGHAVPVPPAGLALSRPLAELLDVRPGGELVIEPVKGLRRPRRVRVDAIIDTYLGLSAYADIRFLSRLVDDELAVSGVQLLTDPRPAAQDALYRELKALPGLEGYSARADVVRNLMDNVVNAQQAAVGILALFAGILFAGATLNASLVSLAERQREVATLLVLGYPPRAVSGLFLRESLVVNLLGTLAGLPLGYLLFRAVMNLNRTDLFRIPLVSPTAAWGQALVVGVVFTLLAHVAVGRAIRRMDVLDRLKTYE
jgi:putative ABC transport system permease protein